jgi:hypothetical protein
MGWQLPKDMRLSFSPAFGLTGTSLDHVFRIGLAVEFSEFSSWFRHPSQKGGVR